MRTILANQPCAKEVQWSHNISDKAQDPDKFMQGMLWRNTKVDEHDNPDHIRDNVKNKHNTKKNCTRIKTDRGHGSLVSICQHKNSHQHRYCEHIQSHARVVHAEHLAIHNHDIALHFYVRSGSVQEYSTICA